MLESLISSYSTIQETPQSRFRCSFTHQYFHVPQDKLCDFYADYCSRVRDNEDLHVEERIGREFQLWIDIETTKVHDEAFVIDIVKASQYVIKRDFDITAVATELSCCVLNSDDKKFSSVYFPKFKLDRKYVSSFLDALKFRLCDVNFTNKIPVEDDIHSVISARNDDYNPLYGSVYKKKKLTVSTFFKDIIDSIQISSWTMEEVIGFYNHFCFNDPSFPQLDDEEIDFFLPLYFSITYEDNVTEPKPGSIIVKGNINKKKSSDGRSDTQKLISMIDEKRADIYGDWIDIGKALHYEDKLKGLEAWIVFSNKGDTFTRDDCVDKWNSFPEYATEGARVLDEYGHKDASTLEYFAKIDSFEKLKKDKMNNPETAPAISKYEEWRKSRLEDIFMEASMTVSEGPVAKAFKECFPYKFACTNYSAQKLYMFDEVSKWIRCDGFVEMIKMIEVDFVREINTMERNLQLSLETLTGHDKRAAISAIEGYKEIIKKIGKFSFKNLICRELLKEYYDKNFDRWADLNIGLTAVKNGVIDVRSGSAVFRRGKPQDYLTKSCNVRYDKSLNYNHPKVEETMNYIEQVYLNPEIRNFFLIFTASFLKAGNHDKLFPIFVGEGDNSKTMIVNLFELTFGSYVTKLPTQVITSKNGPADKPNPALIHSTGARIGVFQEPNKDEIILSGNVKEITGKDTLYARDLYQKGSDISEIVITWYPILIANTIPKIPDCQGAIWERTRVIDHESTWVEKAPDTEEERRKLKTFQRDNNFDLKLKRYAGAFLWICCQNYERYHAIKKIPKPEKVMESTEVFRLENNYFQRFVNHKLVKEEQGYISIEKTFHCFSDWMSGENIRKMNTEKSDFSKQIKKITKCRIDGEYFRGISFKSE